MRCFSPQVRLHLFSKLTPEKKGLRCDARVQCDAGAGADSSIFSQSARQSACTVSEYSGSWCVGVPVHISPSAKHLGERSTLQTLSICLQAESIVYYHSIYVFTAVGYLRNACVFERRSLQTDGCGVPRRAHVSGVGGAGVPAGSPSFVRRYTQSSAVQTYAPALV